jgi:hypothetical protein
MTYLFFIIDFSQIICAILYFLCGIQPGKCFLANLPSPSKKLQSCRDSFSVYIARAIGLYTSDQYSYNQHYFSIGTKTSVKFQVQACNDAHVVLLDSYMRIEAYEIIIGGGGNTLSFLRRTRGVDNKVTVSSDGVGYRVFIQPCEYS